MKSHLALLLLPLNLLASSLWRTQGNSERGLAGNRVAARVGDPLTIRIEETSTFTDILARGSTKTSAVNDTISQLLFSPKGSNAFTQNGQLPGVVFAGNNAFTSSGNTNHSRKISTLMVVMVIDELPNRNLVVEGSRTVSIDGETQYAVVSGIIRPEDIEHDNTVNSNQVANLNVRLFPEGSIANAGRRGVISGAYEQINPLC